MSILVDKNTRLLVQGFTGREGTFHAQQMIDYGTVVVGGTTPGKGGTRHLDRPVYNTVREAMAEAIPNTSIIYVPAPYAADAIIEAADAGIPLIICITEGIPVMDMIKTCDFVKSKGARLIGPNCPGLITPGQAKVGIMPAYIHSPGKVGLVSKSGTLTYEVVNALTNAGMGQSTAIGIGGDPIIGTSFVDVLEMFENDPETEMVVLIGEIGGDAELRAADYIAAKMKKPVAAYIAGRTAPADRRMGHAGAIISSGDDTAAAKMAALSKAGAKVAEAPSEIPGLLQATMVRS